MALTVSITLDDVYAKLGAFIETVVPVGVPVIQLPENRVAMPPANPGFVGMTARVQDRIMTNLDQWDREAEDPDSIDIQQAIRLAVQLDLYGAASGDWAVMLSTVLRDEYSMSYLAPILAPLYTDSPKFAPLIDGEEQYERRWIVGAVLQYNPIVSTPMQFAGAAEATVINVDEAYPP